MSLPIGWTRVRLADVTVPKVEQGEPGATPVHYIDIGSIDRERKIIGPTEQVTAATAPTRARQRVRSGDVLVSMTRPNLNAVAMVPASLDQSVASTGFDVLRATKGVLPEWLYYRVRSHEFVEDICKGVQGVVYPAVRPDDIRSHELPLPPGDLQGAIVTELDSYLSRLDAITANLERAQARLKAYRASVLKAAVEGRLVPTEAELARKEKRSYETGEQLLARILKERRRRWEDAELARLKAAGKTPKDDKWKKKYVEPQPPDTSKLPKLSEGWSWASLSALLAEPLRNGRSAREAASGTRVFTLSSVTQGDFGIHNTKVAAIPSELADDLWARRGDIFIERSNTPELVGTAAMYRGDDNFAVFPDLLIRVRCSSHVSGDYIEAVLRSGASRWHFQKAAKGIAGTMPKIGQATVDALPVPVPPRTEQDRIVEALDRILSVISNAEQQAAENRLRIGRLRQSVLKSAFDGTLISDDNQVLGHQL